jgi:amino acid adenylation domain-containing protein
VTRVVEQFFARVAEQPDAAAVTDGEGCVGYGELSRAAGAIAGELRAAGVEPGDPVIVAADRTRDAVAALVAVAWVRGAYVPLDPAEPTPRVAAMLEDCGARVALVDATGERAVRGSDLRAIDLRAAARGGRQASRARSDEADLAYVLFTSGSTGRPKGVRIAESSLRAFLAGARSWAALEERDVVASFHAFTFDISIWELWGPLVAGAEIVLVPRLGQIDTTLLARLLDDHGVTRLCQTPTALRELGSTVERRGIPRSLRSLFVAGERLDFAWLRPFAAAMRETGLEAWNLYGPTEGTIYATGYLVRPNDVERAGPSLIGRALPHVSAGVFRDDGAPASVGEAGEIWIGGEGVAVGYTGAADASRFTNDSSGRRVFRTGDVARLVDGGEIEFIGRREGLVKIRGYRIEPDEVATALCSHPGVAAAAVVDVNLQRGGGALAAAVVPEPDLHVGELELRRYLSELLPSHMRPTRIVFVDRLPRLASAKLDRPAVRALIRAAAREHAR